MITMMTLLGNEGLALVEGGNMLHENGVDYQEGCAPEGMYRGSDGVYRQRRTCERYGQVEEDLIDDLDDEFSVADCGDDELEDEVDWDAAYEQCADVYDDGDVEEDGQELVHFGEDFGPSRVGSTKTRIVEHYGFSREHGFRNSDHPRPWKDVPVTTQWGRHKPRHHA